MSLTKVSNSMQNSAPFSVTDYYAVGDTDDTASFNRAILAAALQGSGTVIAPPTKTYTVASKVLICANVQIDLCGSTINGSLSSTMFESGYLSGGALITNIGTGNETHTIYGCKVYNGVIQNSLLAFNVFNFLSNCSVSEIRFNFCNKCVYANRSFYSSWTNLTSNNEGGLQYAGIPAFTFYDNVNAMTIQKIAIGHRDTGMYVRGPVFQTVIDNCQIENGVTGIIVENETFAFEVRNCYFEALSGISLDMTFSAQKNNTVVDNNFFHSTGVAIKGQLLIEGLIGAGNSYSGPSTNVWITDDLYSSITVYANSTGGADNATGALPATFNLGKKVQVQGFSNIFRNADGVPLMSSLSPSKLLNFNHVGDAGSIGANQIAFCTSASTGGATFNVVIDTNITNQPTSNLLAFNFTIVDNVGSYRIFGNVYGDTVKQQDTSGKTVTLTAPGGLVVLSASSFIHPAGTFGATGVVRHV